MLIKDLLEAVKDTRSPAQKARDAKQWEKIVALYVKNHGHPPQGAQQEMFARMEWNKSQHKATYEK